MIGRKYGRLVVLRKSKDKSKTGRVLWKCECSCGSGKIVKALYENLQCGEIQSCGCLAKEKLIERKKHALDYMIGNKYGRLTVLERVDLDNKIPMLRCMCDCGNEVIVSARNLRDGQTKSCGCYKIDKLRKVKKDIVGKKFGKLTVVKRVENYVSPNGKTQVQYECKCDCGKEHVIATQSSLVKGNVSSCGCIYSRAEYDFEQILIKNKIKYERQKTFDGCRNKSLLKFDFCIYNDEHKIVSLVELNGSQHYEPRFIGLVTEQESQKILSDTKKRDEIKKKFCKDNNIPLEIIKYTYFSKLDEKFLELKEKYLL